MRNATRLLLLVSILSQPGCQSYPLRLIFLREYFVNASVLLVRDSPAQTGKVLNALPYGTRFEAMEIGESIAIDGLVAKWLRIEPTGYVFGGYSQRSAPLESTRLGLLLTHQVAFIVCSSDTSRFSTIRLFLSSGKVVYSERDVGHCTGPNTQTRANGSYVVTESGLQLNVAQGQATANYDVCGVPLDPRKVPATRPSAPFQVSLFWRPEINAFLPDKGPLPNIPYASSLCAFHPKDVQPSHDSRSMCLNLEAPKSFHLTGSYCPGMHKEWN